MIGKNNWRIPSSQTKRSDGTEEVSGEQLSVGAGASGKSSEELELDKEAAAAVLRGMPECFVCVCVCVHAWVCACVYVCAGRPACGWVGVHGCVCVCACICVCVFEGACI